MLVYFFYSTDIRRIKGFIEITSVYNCEFRNHDLYYLSTFSR